ncbi:MAG: siphovirus ReqiPepy6 Gp37-like family protein [Psychrobacillus psychrodurans]
MKPIRVFTADVELLAEISNYESLMFVRSWHGIGDLELRINRYKNYVDTLQKGNVIVVGKDRHKAYIILHKEIELNENGTASENWLIKALELKIVIGQRITLPPSYTAYDNKKGSAETVMKHYVNTNVINPIDLRRKIPQIIIAKEQGRGNNISWQSRFKNVAEERAEISLISGLGWNVIVDYNLKKLVFDTLEGRDLTVNQFVNSPVIFSPQFDNIQNMSYVDSDLNYRNAAYIAGQGEGIERRVVELGQTTGLSRYELFVDARDIAETVDIEGQEPIPRPDSEVANDLRGRGEQKLAEMIQERFMEAQIMTPIKGIDIKKQLHFATQFQIVESVRVNQKNFSSFIYEEDWDLGDIVTAQNNDWGITLDTRITEVKEIYEPSNYKIEATFGQSRPTLIDKIKQQFAQISPELRR